MDPSVYIILSLDTNLEVAWSTVHLFNEENRIEVSRVRHGTQERIPLDELDACLEWGAEALNAHYQTLFAGSDPAS